MHYVEHANRVVGRRQEDIKNGNVKLLMQCDFENKSKAKKYAELVWKKYQGIIITPGDFFIGDESGIVVIPKLLFSKTMVATLGVKMKESKIIEDIGDGKTLAEIVGFK